MSGTQEQWPDYCPDPDVTIDVTSGSLSLVAGSVTSNVSQFDLTAPDLTCTLWRNGARAAVATIDAQTGAVTLSPVAVAANDRIEMRFRFISPLSLPWLSALTWERVLIFDVPAGNVRHRFGPGHVAMPVPSYELAFGWDSATSKFRMGVRPTNADGATQALRITTRLPGGGSQSSTNVTLTNGNQQTHDSLFTKSQVLLGEFDAELLLASATSGARQEDKATLSFQNADSIPAWSATTVRLYQEKVGGSGKLRR